MAYQGRKTDKPRPALEQMTVKVLNRFAAMYQRDYTAQELEARVLWFVFSHWNVLEPLLQRDEHYSAMEDLSDLKMWEARCAQQLKAWK
jgi:hypothetical protein